MKRGGVLLRKYSLILMMPYDSAISPDVVTNCPDKLERKPQDSSTAEKQECGFIRRKNDGLPERT
ncbi:hypothetical protein C7B82_25310 [Stenomitos frigidus ULC18]|uniref:Uncharacterized protein n=1 Tax=Stenomitos frigidus ULC18 TaxID=2107698 RepID=A0A2T1DW52_9CYAN|nr:hypothetical protein C7B82_25310 [Stenomitos frigidus ULC18]